MAWDQSPQPPPGPRLLLSGCKHLPVKVSQVGAGRCLVGAEMRASFLRGSNTSWLQRPGARQLCQPGGDEAAVRECRRCHDRPKHRWSNKMKTGFSLTRQQAGLSARPVTTLGTWLPSLPGSGSRTEGQGQACPTLQGHRLDSLSWLLARTESHGRNNVEESLGRSAGLPFAPRRHEVLVPWEAGE